MENQLISLEDASIFLGVSKATLRNWDKSNKLKAIRNPINKYRHYKLNDLVELKNKLKPQNSIDSNFLSQNTHSPKKFVNLISNILRDEVADSNIISRFDFISSFIATLSFSSRAPEDEKEFEDQYVDLTKYLNIPENDEFINYLNSISSESFKKILNCANEVTQANLGSDFFGECYEYLIKKSFDKSENQQYFTPPEITKFASLVFPKSKNLTVMDPASGTGGFLVSDIESTGGRDYIALEIDTRLSETTAINLFLHGSESFSVNKLPNGGSLGTHAERFFNSADIVYSNPPFGSDLKDEELLQKFELGRDKSSRRRGILFIEQIHNFLKEAGLALIIIDQSVLTSSKNKDVRNFIYNNFQIQSVIELPVTAFMPYASVATSILILKKSKTGHNQHEPTYFDTSKFIGRKNNGDLDYRYEDGKKSINSDLSSILESLHYFFDKVEHKRGFLKKLSLNDVLDNLSNSYYDPIRENSTNLLNSLNHKLVPLYEICAERSQSYIPAADPISSNIMFTGLAQIENKSGKYIQVSQDNRSIKSAVKKYENGDVIFSKMRPNLRKIAAISGPDGYASAECLVLEIKENSGYTPELLSAVLRSDFVYGQIMGKVTGIGRPRISSKEIFKIMIPKINSQTAEIAAKELELSEKNKNHLLETANDLIIRAENLQNESLTNLINTLIER